MLEPIPFAGMVEIDESFDRTASHMAGKYVSYNEPVAWGMLDKDGGIYDSISPEEHDREEGAYTIPLYIHPAEHDLGIAEAIGFEKGHESASIMLRQQQAEIESLLKFINERGETGQLIIWKAQEK